MILFRYVTFLIGKKKLKFKIEKLFLTRRLIRKYRNGNLRSWRKQSEERLPTWGNLSTVEFNIIIYLLNKKPNAIFKVFYKTKIVILQRIRQNQEWCETSFIVKAQYTGFSQPKIYLTPPIFDYELSSLKKTWNYLFS